MIAGVTKETFPGERRVALVPAALPLLAKSQVEVVVETGAGEEAGFPDEAFREKGGNFLDTAEVYGPYKNEELLGRFLHEVPRGKALPELDPGQQPAERLIPDSTFRAEIPGEDDHGIHRPSFESIGPYQLPHPVVEKGKPAHQKNAYYGQRQECAQHRGETERADRSPEKNQPGEVADRAEPKQRRHPERREDQPGRGGQDNPHAGAANPGRTCLVRGQDSVPAKVSEEYFPTAEWRA